MWSTLSGSMRLMALTAAIALAAVACGGNDDEKGATGMATATPAAESGTRTPQHNTTAPPPNETVPGEMETTARKLLAGELEVDDRSLKLESSGGVVWPDASLGCPQEGMFYAQVVTPGCRLVLDFEGTSYAVHTNSDGSHMVICGHGQ